VLHPYYQPGGDGCSAGGYVPEAVDDDQAIGAASDHAIAAAGVTEPGHGAQDAIAGGKEGGRDRLSVSPRDGGAFEGELHEWRRWQIAEDRVCRNASRPKIVRFSMRVHYRLPELRIFAIAADQSGSSVAVRLPSTNPATESSQRPLL